MTSSTGSLLQSIQILVTGVPEKEKRRLHDIAKSQGAVILSTANANDPPHVVITRTVGSPRYFTILKRNASIPIVTPEWLTCSIEKGTRLPYADFAAGVFQGLVICFSGLSVPEKKEFSKQVESQGGRHSPVLDRSCTHLVTDSTHSDKFIYAQLHGIYTITPAWIEESLSAGRCIDPAKYLISKPVSSQHHSQQQNSHLARQASLQRTGGGQQLDRDRDAAGPGSGLTGDLTDDTLDNNNNKEQLKVDVPGRRCSEEPSLRGGGVDTTGRRAAGFENNKPSSRLANTAAAAAGEIDAAIAATPATGAAAWTTLDHEDDTPLFLDSCFVWVTCCTTAEDQESLVLCAKGGAKRFLEPHPTLTTHVIVGSNSTGDSATAVTLFTSEYKHVPVVGLEWLRRSVARREVLTADERFIIRLPSHLNSTHVAAGGNGRGVGLLGNGGGGSMSLLGFNSTDSTSLPIKKDVTSGAAAGIGAGIGVGVDGGERDDSLNRQNSGAAASFMGGFLDNCYFTLAAVRGTPEGDAAERLIRMHGGRIFSTSVPISSKACFAICPYSLPSHKVHALRISHPDFAAVPETQRYTLWWLECCVQAGDVLPCTTGTACFQPLPFVLPLKDMDKVSVSISGYEPSVRSAIQRTVEIVGGRVSLEYMTAKDTHLIVPVAYGQKYKYSARYGVIPVTATWLLESVKAGKALPPNNFAPLLPNGGVAKEGIDLSQQQQKKKNLPSSSSLLPPIGTQQTLPTSNSGAGTSSYAVAARPSALNQPLNNGFITTAKPSLKQKAQRLREAAKQRPSPFTNTVTQPVAARKPPATSFDFDTLMGPLQKKSGGSGGGGGNSGNIASAAIASLMGGSGPSFTPLPPAAINNNLGNDGLSTRSNQANKTNDTASPVAPPIIQPETEGAAELDAAMNQVSSLLDRMKGRGGALAGGHGSGHSSQHDMPPPPARGGAGGRVVQEDGFGSEGTGAGTVGRGKRSRGGEDSGGGGGMAPRRSSRRGGGGGVISGISELMESESIDMSQQVGYESAAVEVVEVAAVGKDRHAAAEAAAVAKERLTRAATRNRRGQTNSRDILDEF
ncbi:putative DNA topoisomerase 2-binding protein 1 [Nannochloris sp. 'desiccata']|nr:putative DNA topoisomerase 2-binding protein 1 [Chlorella desiccata (nom. nud.)]